MGQKLGRHALDVAAVHEHKETETPAGNPLPKLIHLELPKKLASQRIIILGDVHGCDDELQNLLNKIKFRKGSDVLVFNGDIINKGPKSVQVIDHIRSLDGIVVRGNQDDKALAQYVAWKAGKPLEDAQKCLQDLGDERAEWLRQLPFSLSVPSRKLIVVHAGLIPGIPLHQQSLKTLTELRDLPASERLSGSSMPKSQESPDQSQSQDTSESQQAETSSRSKTRNAQSVTGPGVECAEGEKQLPWASVWKGPKHVVFGHDAGRKLQAWPCATGLDTGCCYGGQLTALIVPALHNQEISSSTSSQAHKSGTDKQEISSDTSTQADNTGTDKHNDSDAAEHMSPHGVGPDPQQQTSQHEAVKSSSSIEQVDGPTSEANGNAQGEVGGVDVSADIVPSLTDWDASFVLVPAKKAYSKKKLWPSLTA